MNLPLERMTPEAAAECVNAFKPKIVYVYHYDQTLRHPGVRGAASPNRSRNFVTRSCRER